jgi:hypothetical protein
MPSLRAGASRFVVAPAALATAATMTHAAPSRPAVSASTLPKATPQPAAEFPAVSARALLVPDPPETPAKARQAARQKAQQVAVQSASAETVAAHRGSRAGAAGGNRPSLNQAYQQVWTAVSRGVGEIAGSADDEVIGAAVDRVDDGNAIDEPGSDDRDDAASGSDRPAEMRRLAGVRAPAERQPAAPSNASPKSPHRDRKSKREPLVETDGGAEQPAAQDAWSALATIEQQAGPTGASAVGGPRGRGALHGAEPLQKIRALQSISAPQRREPAPGAAGQPIVAWASVVLVAVAAVAAALAMFHDSATTPSPDDDAARADKAQAAETRDATAR